MQSEQSHGFSQRPIGRRAGLLLVSLLGVACQARAPQVDLAAQERAIRQASIDFSNAETSGKPDSALTFIWDNAVLQPPDGPQVEGREAIRAFYAPAKLSQPPADSMPPRTARAIQMSASGDLAVEWGLGAIVVQLPSGPLLVHFKFAIVWERRGGVWKVRFNSWSSVAPPPPPTK
jgi:ketosteroid isomerase-like protein